jgi:hypothetical protein
MIAGAVGLWACSGDVCDHAESTSNALSNKAKPCASGDGGTSSITFDKAKCQASVKNCNGDDVAIIQKQLDCLDKVSDCQKGSELAWVGQILACSGDSQKISGACRDGGTF